ncbi:hypothetical protein BJP40_06875 [Streptomyces sp. CC53]|uniref:DUF1540 domain-containing protein n=1 Tax=unclassified Streptomyces TaxID=2593676 RepID=UPI0008DE25C6|nr:MULTISPECIES: DUF1540 domain-containing protein [unclassified Streptomyces]OII61242.1 hypothetical protein BJP40_06875 [Streptomyces sp. CC53]
MDMPVISECSVDDCAYNREQACHALAITVGDTHKAHCDTFFTSASKGGDPDTTGRVGACKVANCRHNARYECQAPGITVGYVQHEVDCLTFEPA